MKNHLKPLLLIGFLLTFPNVVLAWDTSCPKYVGAESCGSDYVTSSSPEALTCAPLATMQSRNTSCTSVGSPNVGALACNGTCSWTSSAAYCNPLNRNITATPSQRLTGPSGTTYTAPNENICGGCKSGYTDYGAGSPTACVAVLQSVMTDGGSPAKYYKVPTSGSPAEITIGSDLWTKTGNDIANSNTGNVGIGTGVDAPTQKLDVRGAIRNVRNTTYDVWIQGGASTASGDNRNLALLGEDEDSGDKVYLNYGGEYASGTIIGGNVGIGTTAPLRQLQVGSGIPASVDTANLNLAVLNGSTVANAQGKALYSYLPSGGTYGTIEAYDYANSVGLNLSINPSGGKVGIGTSSPQSRLQIGNNVGGGGFNTFSDYQILLYQGANATSSYGIGIESDTLAFNADHNHVFYTDNLPRLGIYDDMVIVPGGTSGNSGTGHDDTYFNYNGDGYNYISGNTYFYHSKVGIEKAPTYALDVNGTIRAGDYALLSTGGSAGYYQDWLNGAYRALNSTAYDSGYYFQTNNGTATTMFIGLGGYYNGLVGIGTTDPGAKLTVNRPNGTSGVEVISSQGNTHLPYSDNWNYISGKGVVFRNASNSNGMVFDATAKTLGIGTDSNANRLSVAGSLVVGADYVDQSAPFYNGMMVEGQTLIGGDQYTSGYLYNSAYKLQVFGHLLVHGGAIYADDNINVGRDLWVTGVAGKTGGGSWQSISDARLKDIHGDYTKGLDEITKLKPIEFNYKKDNAEKLPSDTTEIGFTAQDVQPVFPEAVTEDDQGYLNFNMHPINVAVINAIKELKSENDELKAVVCELKPDAKVCE